MIEQQIPKESKIKYNAYLENPLPRAFITPITVSI